VVLIKALALLIFVCRYHQLGLFLNITNDPYTFIKRNSILSDYMYKYRDFLHIYA
jgi:hypothetical protein